MKYVDKSPDEARAKQPMRENKRENAKIAKANAMLEKMIREGTIPQGGLQKAKEMIMKKTGAYPMGSTN
jgi:hypothetical protein